MTPRDPRGYDITGKDGLEPGGTAGVLLCVECGSAWLPDDHERWRAYVTTEEPFEVIVYCSACAGREFDSPPYEHGP